MRRSQFVARELGCVVAAWIVIAIAQRTIEAAELSPCEARVVATGASVHSGPGEKFYPTDTLAQGDVVEIYKEKPGGWLAIRPPVNSFSWVAAGDLKLRDDGLAEVINDDVASRIGSRLSDQHNAAQVRLKKGEVLEVLDEEAIGGETWYKIAPPAGEFRWIQASLVERIGGVRMASAETTAPANTNGSEPMSDTKAPPLMSQPSGSSVPAAPLAATPAGAVPVANITPAAPPVAKSQTVGPVADDLSRELASIELRLSRMVAAPVNLWNTALLERDAARLLTRAQTTAERDAVQVTLNKINQFAVIGQRTNQLPATPMGQSGQPPITPITPTPGAAAAPVEVAAGGGPYDAVGILRPVVSRRPGAPQFALVDDQGQVLSFVTPSPDVNLQPYLGRRVGVTGSRGFIAEFNRAHVTAARVAPLGDRVLR